MPTAEQAIKAAILCQYLSNYYQPIHLFRFDEERLEIFIIANKLLASLKLNGASNFFD
jgi:hypothetical protein